MVKLRKYTVVKSILEIIILTFLYAMLDNMAGIKKYAFIVGLCIVFVALGFKKRWSAEALLCLSMPVFCYVLLGGLSAFIATSSQITTVKVMLYVLLPFVFSFFLYIYYGKSMTHIADMHFLGSILAYAIFDAPYFAKIFQWESIYAFVFGVFVIFYAYQKKWLFFVIAASFMYFTEKRIAIFAVLIALLLMGILWLFEQNKKLVFIFWTFSMVVIFLYIYLIYHGILENICWGANINTNGRVEMYGKIATEADFSLGYFGRGIGIVEQLLECYNIAAFQNLHNDLLKFYIELGFLGLFLYLGSYGIMFMMAGKYFGKSCMCYLFLISTYTMIVLATDNISIYMIYLIPMYVTMFATLSSGEIIEYKKGLS